MAAWCLLTGQSPEVYKSLPRLERSAFVTVRMRRN